jgi:hypothetical protein
LSYIGVFVLFVRAKIVERLDAHDANDSAKYIGLLKIKVNEFRRSVLYVLDGLTKVADLEFRWKKHISIKAMSVDCHYSRKLSRLVAQFKSRLHQTIRQRSSFAITFSASSKTRKLGDGPKRCLEEQTVMFNADALISDGNGRSDS